MGNNYDLGVDQYDGIDRQAVDLDFRHSQFNIPTYPCVVCGNTASYALHPKDSTVPAGGYLCGYHIHMYNKKPYTNQYYVKEIK